MTLVINFAYEHPSLAQDGVCPPSPNSSVGSAGYRDRILIQNQEFQAGSVIWPMPGPAPAPAPSPPTSSPNATNVVPVKPELVEIEPVSPVVADVAPVGTDAPATVDVADSGPSDEVVAVAAPLVEAPIEPASDKGSPPTASSGENLDNVSGSNDAKDPILVLPPADASANVPGDVSNVVPAVPVPVIPASNPAPSTVAGGKDPLVGMFELGAVEWSTAPTQWYRTNFDPSRLRLAHTSGGAQLLIAVDPDRELEIETTTPSGSRGVAVQVNGPPTSDFTSQTDPPPAPPAPPSVGSAGPVPSLEGSLAPPASVVDSTATDTDTTVSSTTAYLEHQQFIAARELSKLVLKL